MTTKVEKTITVDAPVRVVYDQWTQFEEFPNFMGGVSEVKQLDDKRLYWKAEIAGIKREWEATILEQVPDQKVAWAATEGATNAGSVSFSPAAAGGTYVRLHLEYEPEGLLESIGDKVGFVGKQAESDLEKFKSFIEAKGSQTGGWRGTVDDGAAVGTPGIEHAAASQGDSGKAGVSGKVVAAGVAAAAAGVAAAVAAKTSGSDDSGTDLAPPPLPEVDASTPVADTGWTAADDAGLSSTTAAAAPLGGAGTVGVTPTGTATEAPTADSDLSVEEAAADAGSDLGGTPRPAHEH